MFRTTRRYASAVKCGLTYLLRDEFTDDAAAPLTSPRTARPGPGTLTLVDEAPARWQVTGGVLETTGSGLTAATSPTAHIAVTRAVGIAVKQRTLRNSTYGAAGAKLLSPHMGFSTVTGTNIAVGNITGLLFYGGRFAAATQNASSPQLLEADASDTYFTFVSILRSSGAFHVINDKLAFIDDIGSQATMYAGLGQLSTDRHPPKCEYIRVAQLGAPWNTDNGIATANLSGARSASDTFSHEANAQWIVFTVTALPSVGNIEIRFRVQDSSNYWSLTVSSAGAYSLNETVASVTNQRATIASNQANDRLLCVIDGANARLMRMRSSAGTQSSIYASVSTFTTQTTGSIQSLGTGGGVSDLITYPRTLSGAALSALESM